MLPSCFLLTNFMGMLISFSSRFGSLQTAQRGCLRDHGVPVLERPAHDLKSNREALCQEKDVRHQTQQCRRTEGLYRTILGLSNTSAAQQTDQLHTSDQRLSSGRVHTFHFNCIRLSKDSIKYKSLT